VDRLPSFFLCLFAGLTILGLVYVIDTGEMKAAKRAVNDDLRKELNAVGNELQSALNARLYHTRGLASFVVARPDYSWDDFERYANAIQGRQQGILSLQIAPNAVVTYITNHERNRAALGHDLLADPVHIPMARKGIAERRLLIVGPVELRQGGTAIIARQAIFLPDVDTGIDEFWGFAITLIDVPPLLAEAGLGAPPPGLEFALRGKDGRGAKGEVFFGDGAVFSGANPVIDVVLPSGTWQLAARHSGPIPAHQLRWRLWLWVGGLGFALALGWLLYNLIRKPAQLKAAADRATQALQESQTALRRSEELYTRATHAGRVGVWDWNLETDALSFSRELEEMLGCAEGEHIHTFVDFRRRVTASHADYQKQEALAYLADDTKDDFTSEYSYVTADGEVRWMATRANKVFDETGRAVGLTGTDTDVTSMKRAQEALNEAKEQAETANRTKSEFLANMSHELRTPLNSILGFSELLRSEAFGRLGHERYREYADDIHGSGTHLLDVINDILDVSRIEAGVFELSEEAIDLSDLFDTCLTMIGGRAKEGGVDLKVDLAADLPQLTADPTRMKQIVLNLLSNAVKFTPPGGRVVLGGRLAEDGDLLLVVNDTGIGISEKLLSHVFEPFTQVESVHQRSHEGAGLGLTLVNSLVRMHGGMVNIESDARSGTTVQVRLPAARLVFYPTQAVASEGA